MGGVTINHSSILIDFILMPILIDFILMQFEQIQAAVGGFSIFTHVLQNRR